MDYQLIQNAKQLVRAKITKSRKEEKDLVVIKEEYFYEQLKRNESLGIFILSEMWLKIIL